MENNTKSETYLAAANREYEDDLPIPQTKVEVYLYKLAKSVAQSGAEPSVTQSATDSDIDSIFKKKN